ncbi:MAG: hypothetical protein WA996_21380 [Candidatus Promineifilaceae bacterium]
MKWLLTLSFLAGLLMTACRGVPAPDQESPVRGIVTATYTIQPIQTATPTPIGTWKTVIDGMVYDNVTEPGKPIVGASISYHVLQSYFPGLQEGRPSETISDAFGEFSFPVIVHDTDSIRILVEAQGYTPYEERLIGVDLFGGRSFDIGLTPIVTATIRAP